MEDAQPGLTPDLRWFKTAAVAGDPDSEFPDYPAQVRELAERCIEAVARAHAFTLDYSEASLAVLDHYLGTVPADQPPMVELIAPMAGAYFGEVARRRFDGQWRLTGLAPTSWSIELANIPLSFSPVAMAAEAICQGETEGEGGAIHTGSMEQAVMAMLEQAPPLPADQFYSLTGRLETLEQIADFMHELARQTREDADDGADEAGADDTDEDDTDEDDTDEEDPGREPR